MDDQDRKPSVFRRIGRAWLARRGLAPEDINEPTGIVFSNKRSEALADHVFDLLDQDLPDADIVQKLISQANPRDLAVAAKLVNINNYAQELSHYNQAWRLLNAAASGTVVAEPSPDQLVKFEILDELSDEPVELAYAKLVERQPALGEVTERLSNGSKPTVSSFAQLDIILKPLVGPYSRSTDLVIRSHIAAQISREYLAYVSGLVDA
jgi:hypothetical protein